MSYHTFVTIYKQVAKLKHQNDVKIEILTCEINPPHTIIIWTHSGAQVIYKAHKQNKHKSKLEAWFFLYSCICHFSIEEGLQGSCAFVVI